MSEEKKPVEGNKPQLVGSRKGAAIKALLLVAFVIVAIYIIRFTSAREFFTEKSLNQFLDRAGLWAETDQDLSDEWPNWKSFRMTKSTLIIALGLGM